jgi:tRNA pseudouridine55 synthase
MHSALKHEGKALYEYARAGVDVERAARRVTIHAIDIVSWQDAELVLDVRCSKGTYIRTLAEDIGAALGCGAHLSRPAPHGQRPAWTWPGRDAGDAAKLDEAEREALLLPPDVLVAGWPVPCTCPTTRPGAS